MDTLSTFIFGSSLYSGGTGLLLGYITKKIVKLLLVIGGLYLASLYWLADKGVITIDQTKLHSLVENTTKEVINYAMTTGYVLANLGGAAIGFVIGWKLA